MPSPYDVDGYTLADKLEHIMRRQQVRFRIRLTAPLLKWQGTVTSPGIDKRVYSLDNGVTSPREKNASWSTRGHSVAAGV